MLNIYPASPDDVQSLLTQADQAARDRDFLRSIDILETAIQKAPNNFNVFLTLAALYGKRYDYAKAGHALERAIELAPEKGQMLTMAGGRCLRMANHQFAKDFFTRATTLPNPPAMAYVGLAEVAERAGHLQEALGCLERALARDPACGLALLVRARIYRRLGELVKARSILQGLVDNASGKLSLRAEAGSELARVLDLQGAYDDAIAAVLTAKRLFRPPERVQATHARLRKTMADSESGVTAEMFARWRAATPPVNIAVVIGRAYAMEPTHLENALSANPGVSYLADSRIFLDEIYLPTRRSLMPGAPLLTFLDSLPPELLQEMRQTYLNRNQVFSRQPIANRLIVEKNHILNALLPSMLRFFPETQVVWAVQDPRDAVLENFLRLKAINPCSYPFLTLGGAVEECVLTAKYLHTMMARLGNRKLQVKQESPMANAEGALPQVARFLALPSQPAMIAAPGSSWAAGHWKNYERHLAPFADELNAVAKTLGY